MTKQLATEQAAAVAEEEKGEGEGDSPRASSTAGLETPRSMAPGGTPRANTAVFGTPRAPGGTPRANTAPLGLPRDPDGRGRGRGEEVAREEHQEVVGDKDEDEEDEDGVKQPGGRRKGYHTRRQEVKINKHYMQRTLEAEMAAEQKGATTADKEAAVKARATYNDWAAKRGTVWVGEEEFINAWKTAAKKN